MSDRRSNNSLLLLTTLGVYFSLVLVGSCPSVLAQAATTRDYDIRSEVVIEDDLDKKPDDQTKVPDYAIDRYFDSLATFVTELRGFEKRDDLRLSPQHFQFRLDHYSECTAVCEPCVAKSPYFGLLNSEYRSLIREIDLPDSFSDCAKLRDGFYDRETAKTLQFLSDGEEYKFTAAFTKLNKQRAGYLASVLPAIIAPQITSENSGLLATRLRLATSVWARNNQVFIVTNLPRASIDDPASK